jgi:hypothetical protein
MKAVRFVELLTPKRLENIVTFGKVAPIAQFESVSIIFNNPYISMVFNSSFEFHERIKKTLYL